MKKIINGVLFDTEKMEVVAKSWNDDKIKPFDSQTLYKGNKYYALRIKNVFRDTLIMINKKQFKKILAELDVEKYLELYGDQLEEA